MWSKPSRFAKALAIVFALGQTTCERNPPEFEIVEIDPKLVVRFSIENNGEAIDVDEPFTDAYGYECIVRELKFFVSDLALIDDQSVLVPLKDVTLFNYREISEGENQIFNRSVIRIVPKGKYSQLRFDFGLPKDLNASDPAMFANDHPLGVYNLGMHWDWATKYKFMELRIEVLSHNGEPLGHGIEVHSGLDTLFRPGQSFDVALSLEAFDKDTLHLVADWNMWFHGGEEPTGLDTEIFTHGTATVEDFEIARRVTDQFVRCLKARP
ncbi:MAG: hypothetical protein Kow0075_09080 [Salibacteraceae bacterium]